LGWFNIGKREPIPGIGRGLPDTLWHKLASYDKISIFQDGSPFHPIVVNYKQCLFDLFSGCTIEDEHKAKRQILSELVELRKRITELEELKAHLKRAEEALRESEREKRALLDSSIDRIRIVDKDMKILWANETTVSNLDVGPEDIVGETCYKLFTNREIPCDNCPTKKSIETGKVEHAIIHKPKVAGLEGETYWDCYTVPIRNESGEIVRLVQVTRNVTEKIEAEKELERRHNELRAINGIFLRLTKEYDLNGICFVLNDIMEDFYPGSETLVFLLNPDRDSFYFPLTEKGRMRETCFERAKRKIISQATEHNLLTCLTNKELRPTCSGKKKTDCPPIIRKVMEGFNIWIAVPIQVEDICHGLFAVGSLSTDITAEKDLIFVETLIQQISGILRYQIAKEVREEDFRKQLTGPDKFMGIVGRSQAMQKIYRMIQAVADSPSTVLITGESGTGKELVARAIHNAGKYKDTPFVAAHCSSFVPTLVHSEIFGHEKGAFTGAVSRKRGRLERAQGGILFLDEVSDLPLETQVLLLRFLQEKSFERVGGERPVEINVKIIAATNKDIEKEMKSGRVREDFYYRLNVIRLKLPPSRERLTDVPLLANHFLRTYCLIEGKEINGFDTDAMKLMMDYHWPGNVRELQNMVAKCVVLASSERIGIEALPKKMQSLTGSAKEFSLAKNERDLIINVMRECNWNKHEAARLLCISRSTLYSKLKKYEIQPNL